MKEIPMLNLNISLRPTAQSDWPAIAALLEANKLPLDGAQDHLSSYLLATQGNEAIGTVGAEVYGDLALLRSVAIAPGLQRQGIGKLLVSRLLQFDVAVVLLNVVGVPGVLHTPQLVNSQIAVGPVFNVAVWGVNPEDLDQAVALEMHDGSAGAQPGRGERAVARAIRIDQSVGLELGQPSPATITHLLRLASEPYQLSKATQAGAKPRTLAV